MVLGGSVQHERDMKRRKSVLPPGPYTVQVRHYPRGGPSMSTITGRPNAPGTGRAFAVDIVEKMPRRGKPPFLKRVQADKIVAHVQFLKDANPGAKMDDEIVPEAAQFFGVTELCGMRFAKTASTDHRIGEIPGGSVKWTVEEAD